MPELSVAERLTPPPTWTVDPLVMLASTVFVILFPTTSASRDARPEAENPAETAMILAADCAVRETSDVGVIV